MNSDALLRDYKAQVEKRLAELLPKNGKPHARLSEAMRYSLMAGGKRLRPLLTMAFCAASGKNAAEGLDFGCAVEMLHTYSLIHDDLPCMDNDELRRGKPTNHVIYGEWLALLAGDALQAEAFSVIASAGKSPEITANAVKVLSFAAGFDGICGGQYLDLAGEEEKQEENELKLMHSMKTAALISAACELGCIAAGAGEDKRSAAREYGQRLGLAFQLRDDILDVEGSTEQLGKEIGSDEKNQKTNFISIYGLEKCQKLVFENTELAKAALKPAFEDAELLCAVADRLVKRDC
jgi:geranylgeranyl diphosphate synthase type II